MGRDKGFNDSAKLVIENRQSQSKDDFNNELTDRETARAKRFGYKSQRIQNEARKKQQEHTLKQLLLINAAYAKLYNETLQNLRYAESAVYDAQLEGAALVNEAQAVLDQTLANASTTVDGTKIFRCGDGSVYTKDGQLLNGAALDGITWRDGAPSWEEYQKQLKDLQENQHYHNRMNAHAERLSAFRIEMEDKNNPPSEERLNVINNESEVISNDARNDNNLQSAEFSIKKVEFSSLPDLKL